MSQSDGGSWYILGIDLGYAGFACLKKAGSNNVCCLPVPLRSPACLRHVRDATDLVTEDYDIPQMTEIARAAYKRAQGSIVAVVEEPFFGGPRSSHKSLRSLMLSQGYWAAACAVAGIPVFSIDASTWKARLGLKAALTEATVELRERRKKLTSKADKTKIAKQIAEIGKELAVDMANKLVGRNLFVSHDAAESFLIAYALENCYDEFQWLRRPISAIPSAGSEGKGAELGFEE